MNKELFTKHRRLIITILVIVVAIVLVLPLVGLIKWGFTESTTEPNLDDPNHNVGTVDDTGGFTESTEEPGVDDPNRIVGSVDENNDIILTDLPNGTYTLYYEDDNGIIADYNGIIVSNLSYTGLIKENSAPMGATKIGVYDASGLRKGTIDLGTLTPPDLGAKLYSHAAISDIHLSYDTAPEDFQKALAYFNSLEDLLFVNICGDLTDAGSVVELTDYKEMRDTYSAKPVYAVSGNHEYTCSTSYEFSNWTTYTGHHLWYSYTQGNDVYIMVGMNGYSSPFSTAELQWLYETLEANRNKRCFVYQHIFPWGGSGDVAGLNGHGDLLDNVPGHVFLSLMSHYKNVIWFHGHSHQLFQTQEQYQINNVDRVYARYSVHIPSLALPRIIVDDAQYGVFEASEGYVVDVYENGIILRGRDFVQEKFLPIATFYLDTTLQTVAEETYVDPTGTISNKHSPRLDSLPEGTAYMINRHYNNSLDEFTDANGFTSLIIPCVGDGMTAYTLELKNTGLDITTNRTSRHFLFDEEYNFIGWSNGSTYFSEMAGITVSDDGTIRINFVPMAKTAYIVLNIAESNEPISIRDIDDYVISLTEIDPSFTVPDDTSFLLNQRYSESSGGIIDANGYASFIIPCVGDGTTAYTLKLQNTGLDLAAARTSRHFLLDAEQHYLGWANGSSFFSEMTGLTVLDDGSIRMDFVPVAGTAYVMICINEKNNSPISILDVNDYVISLTETPPLFTVPDGTTHMLNQRYSESSSGIIAANGYASFVIPCVGDGTTAYTLKLQNTGLDLTAARTSRHFLLDSDQNCLGWANGSAFFSEMSGITTLSDGTVQMDFVPPAGTAFIIVCIAENSNNAISVLDINDYVISLAENHGSFTLPDGATYMLNQRYSESGGGIITAKGYASLMIPCVGDDTTSYTLQFRNTGLDLTESRTSRQFLFDADGNFWGWANGSAFFSEMSGMTTLSDGMIQMDFVPPTGTAFILICIAENSSYPISILDIGDYIITLTRNE